MPFPGLGNADAAEKIITGYKLFCPKDADEFIYDVMLLCWKENPKER